MNDSKFDDYDRHLIRELVKKFFFAPYCGALSAGGRSYKYLRYFGFRRDQIAKAYDTVSIERVRSLAGAPSAPAGTPFAERHFTIIARLIEKKNLFVALDAYHAYCERTPHPRALHICGSGPLDTALRARARALDLGELIVFRGWLQSEEICRTLATSLVLILPSIEEQFGLVVIEALAMGLPVILSECCGARDELVRTGVNGFVVEPDNVEGMSYFMQVLCTDETLWTRMAFAAGRAAPLGDVKTFVDAVSQLIGRSR